MMLTFFKRRVLHPIAVVLIAALFFAACEMGLGPSIDLEPPELWVTHIIRPDGTEEPISEDDGKLVVGPGLLVGNGFQLKGRAQDNVRVVDVVVEETGNNAQLDDGSYPIWKDANLTAPARMGAEQEWTIFLDNIRQGERVITITAYDQQKNIGPNTVKQLTLLVDTEDPFVDGVKIERFTGVSVDLLPRVTLSGLNADTFEYIDYYQNESFSIRAEITHEFSLEEITIHIHDENGNAVLGAAGKVFQGTNLYAPVWDFTAADFANYPDGPYYMDVTISAKAEAGHSGEYVPKTNYAYSFIWYPDADIPRIQRGWTDADENEQGIVLVQSGGILLVRTFDDDNLDGVYAAVVSADEWDKFMPGSGEQAKLDALILDANRVGVFAELAVNIINPPLRSRVVAVSMGDTRGEYRLIVLAQDQKRPNATPGIWNTFFRNVRVIEEGIPDITIENPTDNSTPVLEDGKFILDGYILDINGVETLSMVWIPDGLNLSSVEQQAEAEAILTGKETNIDKNDVKTWTIPLDPPVEANFGGKVYKQQNFSQTLDVFNDFTYNGELENAPKYFMLYTQGQNGDDVFQTLRLGAYRTPPVAKFDEPESWERYGQGETIHIEVQAYSQQNVNIAERKLILVSDGSELTLIPKPGTTNIYTATDSRTLEPGIATRNFSYRLTVKDILGNEAEDERFITVSDLPWLSGISSTRNSGSFSSRDVINIRAEFSSSVALSDLDKGTPYIELRGFVPDTPRYAYYVSGEGSKNLSFEYDVLEGDNTNGGPLRAVAIHRNGAHISAYPFANDDYTDPYNLVNNTDNVKSLADNEKVLVVDGIAPVITGVKFSVDKDTYDIDYFDGIKGWVRAGALIQVEVTTDKTLRVLGTPTIQLSGFTPSEGTTLANRSVRYQNISSDYKTMTFQYRVQGPGGTSYPNGDEAEELYINLANCFIESDRISITDRVGSQGNYLSLANTNTVISTIQVDAIPPAPLTVVELDAPNGYLLYFTIDDSAIETQHDETIVEFTLDGMTYERGFVPNSSWEFGILDGNTGSYRIAAHQIDRAGNTSDPGNVIRHDMLASCELATIVCDSPDGTYPGGTTLNFRMIFSGHIVAEVSGDQGPSITLEGGSGPNSGDVTIYLLYQDRVLRDDPAFDLTFSWTVDVNRIMMPVRIKSISLNGVVKETDDSKPDSDDPVVIALFHTERELLNVTSVKPYVTHVNGTAVASMSNYILEPTGDESVLTLTFNNAVWAEAGNIIVKPAPNWLVPPVLTGYDNTADPDDERPDSEFSRISVEYPNEAASLLDSSQASYYISTTHGLLHEGSTYVPDIETKYVLNFASGLDNNRIRTLLEETKFNWQEIESVNANQVTVTGTTTVTVKLDKLPDGRQWKLELEEGAFRDAAGNTSAAWTDNTNTFWSSKTSAPVIRVNRVSNNHVSVNPTTNTVTGTKGTTNEVTSRVNVQYRIDSETPGAEIQYGTSYGTAVSRSSEITTAMGTPEANYYANANDGVQNSALADASGAEMDSISVSNSYTAGDFLTIGDTNIYTARKDYIAARATRTATPALAQSDRAYEGAFKTLIVYRNPNLTRRNASGTRYLKLEATDTRNGAVTISGFPMNYNDMSGRSSKYFFRNGTENNSDWVWISWEMVSEFWQVAMVLDGSTPNSALTGDPWEQFDGEWYRHNYRKYGNWGLRVGND